MIRSLTFAALAGLSQCEDATVANQESEGLPSGLVHKLTEVRLEPADVSSDAVQILRLRYVNPNLSADGFDAVEKDFARLCETDGLSTRDSMAPNATEIIISLASRHVQFGESAPDVTQFIDAFLVKDEKCRWRGL